MHRPRISVRANTVQLTAAVKKPQLYGMLGGALMLGQEIGDIMPRPETMPYFCHIALSEAWTVAANLVKRGPNHTTGAAGVFSCGPGQ
jgi:hypothetical protein